MIDSDTTAFNTAVEKFYPTLPSLTNITHHNCALKYLLRSLRISAVVSPANSYTRLDGAFDDALARAYGPPRDYGWITRKAQKVLYEKWRGFAPPGTCTVVPLDHDEGLEPVEWDREVVYECTWSLLCAVDNHNREVKRNHTTQGRDSNAASSGTEIKSIVITSLATGVGHISVKRWAKQCVLAIKHWVEAVENPAVWGNLDWGKAFEDHEEVVETYRDDM